MTPVEKASQDFAEYAGKSLLALRTDTETDWLIELQVRLAAWQTRNFGASPDWQLAMGAAEEVGELCHAVLKRAQRIRGMGDPAAYREAAGDAIADAMIYLIQLCTNLRLDARTLLRGVAEDVMRREWRKPDGR